MSVQCQKIQLDSKRKELGGIGFHLSEMGSVKVDFEVGNDGVAVITMSNPPVNALAIPSELHHFFNLR